MSDALVPPKPKLLLSAARTSRCLAWCGTRSTPAVPSLGLSRLSVGGTTWSRSARMQKIASTAPAPPSRWPIADLVELVAERRRGPVGVDIVDVDRIDLRALQRHLHRPIAARALRMGRGDVVGV